MNITYDYYRIFYYAAKYNSFSKAATILMSNQPNVSRAMNNLEKQLGCKLFLRSNRGITLTPEGKKLYSHVAVAFRQLHSAELELANSGNLENGTVTISASETALHGILLHVLKDFHNIYPNIHIHILSNNTPQSVESVQSGLADFAVVTSSAKLYPLHEIPICEFHEILVCSPKYSYLADKAMTLAELQKYPMVCLNKSTMTYSYYSDLFMRRNLVLAPEVEVATSDQLIPVIMHDLGIGFVPDFLVREPLEKGKLYAIPLSENLPSRHICLVEDNSHPLNIAAGRLKSMLLDSRKTTEN